MPPRPVPRWLPHPLLPYAGVFAIAYVTRLLYPLLGGGLSGFNGYDAGTYYAAADALSHGLLPYRDFVLVHPPLITYLLFPFALLGRLTTDPTGFAAAQLAFIGIGALNAALVVAVARRWACSMRAAVAGGLIYAVSWAAVGAEFLSRLEPVGNLLVLLALFALAPGHKRSEANGTPAYPMLAGMALGAAISTKIWWALPAVILLVALFARVRTDRRRWSVSGRMLAGGVISAVVINAVPFLADPVGMTEMVLGQQLSRRVGNDDYLRRITHLIGIPGGSRSPVPVLLGLVAFIILALCVWCAVRAVRTPLGKLAVTLLVGQVLVIVASPSWFTFYTDYTAVALALVVTTAFDAPAPGWRRVGARAPWFATVTLVGLGIATVLTTGSAVVLPVENLDHLTATVANDRCVMARTPAMLILTNTLDRSFRPHCRNWVDAMGLALDPTGMPSFRKLPRHVSWDAAYRHYLLSGQALITYKDDPLPTDITRRLTPGRILARDNAMTIYSTRGINRR